MKVTATAQRSGGWWAVEVPEVPGVFTQARRLDQIEAMVKDAVALMEDVAEDDVDVQVVPVLEAGVARELADAKTARAQAEALSDKAAAGIRGVARKLAALEFSMRDIGVVLGVSHQRVAQLLDPAEPRTVKARKDGAEAALQAALDEETAKLTGSSRAARAAAAKARRELHRSAKSGKFVKSATAARRRSNA